MAPVSNRIASSSVVLPLKYGPTSAMHRGPLGALPAVWSVIDPPMTCAGAERLLMRNWQAASGAIPCILMFAPIRLHDKSKTDDPIPDLSAFLRQRGAGARSILLEIFGGHAM